MHEFFCAIPPESHTECNSWRSNTSKPTMVHTDDMIDFLATLASIKTIVIPIAGKSSIHGDDLSGDEGGSGKTEKDHQAGNLLRFSDPTDGCSIYHRFEIRLVFQHLPCEFGVDVPGSHTIYADAVQTPFTGKISGELIHRCLGGCVGCSGLDAGHARNRSDVDDRARRFARTSFQEGIALHCQIKHGIEIGPPHGLCVLLGVFNGWLSDVRSHIVDEYVQLFATIHRPEPAFDFGKERFQTLRFGNVRAYSRYVETLLFVPFFCHPRQVVLVPAANQYRASFPRQFFNDGLATEKV